MACRAPDTFYVAEQLRDITKCSSKQAEELLAVSKNDLMIAVEKFFAQEVEVEEEVDKQVVWDPRGVDGKHLQGKALYSLVWLKIHL